MNILIVAHHFPPENAMASLRPYSWAKYWSQAGHHVCVLTTEKKAFDAPLTLTLSIDSFQVEEVPYLFKQGRSSSQPMSDASQSASTFFSRFKDNQLVKAFVLRSRKLRQAAGTGALLSIRSFWIWPAVQKAIDLHQQTPFDCVISTYGPPAPHIVAGLLKQRIRSLFWIADYRDLWNDYNFETRRWPFSAIERYLEDFFVSSSDLLATVSEPLADILRAHFNKTVVTIENGFDTSDLASRQRDYFPEDGKIRLVYTGRLHSKKRDPLPLLKAIKQLEQKKTGLENNLEVLFYSNEVGELPKLIYQLGLSHIVKIPGFVDRASALSIQCSANALIFIDWSDPSIDGILTGKIFEYLYAGKPILGIGSDKNRAAGRLILDSKTGICLGNSPDTIATVILRLLKKESLDYFPKKDVLNRYTRQGLAEKLLNAVTEHMKG